MLGGLCVGSPVPAQVGDWLDLLLCLAALVSVIRFRSHLAAVVALLAVDPLWATAAAQTGLEARAVAVVGVGVVAFAVHAPLWAAFALGLARLGRADRRASGGGVPR